MAALKTVTKKRRPREQDSITNRESLQNYKKEHIFWNHLLEMENQAFILAITLLPVSDVNLHRKWLLWALLLVFPGPPGHRASGQ